MEFLGVTTYVSKDISHVVFKQSDGSSCRKVTQTVLFVPAKSLTIYTSVDPVLPMYVVFNYFISRLLLALSFTQHMTVCQVCHGLQIFMRVRCPIYGFIFLNLPFFLFSSSFLSQWDSTFYFLKYLINMYTTGNIRL